MEPLAVALHGVALSGLKAGDRVLVSRGTRVVYDSASKDVIRYVQVVGTLELNEMPTPVRQIMDQLLVEFTTIGFLSDDNPGRRKQPVVTIAAPVFDHRAAVALMVAVHPLCPLNARQVQLIGKQLTEETTAISESQLPAVQRIAR